jgi:hypothetical protein
VKCVDCGTQTLPQNASGERSWTLAAALRIDGRINDGVLCFECGNKRKVLLGVPVPQDESKVVKGKCDRPVPAGPIETARRRFRINKREHVWEVSTLESLMVKWKDHYADDEYKDREMDLRKWIIRLNDRQVLPEEFGSLPVSDGDEISILAGRLLHPY